MAHARRRRTRRAVEGRAARRRRLSGAPRHRRQDGGPAAAAAGRRAARARDRAGGRRIRHGHRRRGARRARRGRLRGVGGPRRSWSSARRREARPAPRRGSRTTSASRRASRATSSRAARCSRLGGWARRSSSRARIKRIDPATRQVHLDGGDVLRARTIILACGVAWRQLGDGRVRPALRQGHLLRRGAQRGAEHPRRGHPHRRRGQLGGPGRDVLRHPRAERDDPLSRRRRSRRACRATSSTRSPHSRTSEVASAHEIAAAYGDAVLEAIDVRNVDTGETTRLESGGLFIFIGADAETDWLPPEIALDTRGYVLTGTDVVPRGRGSTGATRTSSKPASPESSPAATCGSARQACCRRSRRGQHGDRVRPPVPEGRGRRRGSSGVVILATPTSNRVFGARVLTVLPRTSDASRHR